jgi:hypothetical protein
VTDIGLSTGLCDLRAHLRHFSLPSEEIQARALHIYEASVAGSRHLGSGDFRRIAPEDLSRLFGLYDASFFGGHLKRALEGPGGGRLFLRLSQRMTRAGGRTTVYRRHGHDGEEREFEIAVSTTLLFQTFHDVHRTVTVVGLECNDRLDALLRIFEHELIHLCEFLAWGASSCERPRFHDLAGRLFGHRGFTHELVTARERALARHGVRLGDRVAFGWEGRRLVGFVNRITKRATVLVESADGARYDDGRRYRKYYVPLDDLETLD